MQQQDGSVGKIIRLTHILAASFAGLIAAATASRYKKQSSAVTGDQNIIPILDKTESGRVGRFERFSHYVARQMGFEDASEVGELCKMAEEYLRKSKGCEESIYEYLANDGDNNGSDLMYVKLIEEFERCILSYFSFHWNHASFLISQVLSSESEQRTKLKNILLAATRKQRFAKVTKNLKVTRVISTLVDEIKAIKGASESMDIMVPMAHSERSPVLLLMAGGMGAGKSTVLKDILKESFWSKAATNAVVVEADAFKESDVIYRNLNSRGHHDDMLQTAELVHQSSTDAASSLLVTALNEGRDVIMDGTLSWESFVEQTISMASQMQRVNEAEEEQPEENNGEPRDRKPYRIELVGVICDGYLAVVRGIRRAIINGRAVRVNSQLKSHKRFANAFPRYCKLVDNARLYCTNAVDGPPKLIAWKDGDHNLLVDPEDIKCLEMIGGLNVEADSIYELYKEPSLIMEPGSVWKETVLSSSRTSDHKLLRETLLKIGKSNKK
ncbi:hypothetical protein AHAS_Ahas19G0235000 [Arachis hypogaea]|uniref:Zeta toxin domain-containing protein n=1 Tax=Arachis hypogaea TaxID=3818 RepID=A0A444XQU0_ARAHY|nr:hypothetical protein Ahy_B09g097951 [Arachis hypogaea]